MGLVDYSDSDSESETPKTAVAAPAAAAAATSRKPFAKLVDKSNPGKIVVNLPLAATSTDDAGPGEVERAPKRLKTGTSRFSSFSSFLPPPRASAKPSAQPPSDGRSAPRIGVHLKTSAEAALRRESPAREEDDENVGGGAHPHGSSSTLEPTPPKAQEGPSIPEGQRPDEEVKLVGKPLMFKPLSVARKPAKKAGTRAAHPKAAAVPVPLVTRESEPKAAAHTKKKVSLFSIGGDEAPTNEIAPPTENNRFDRQETGHDGGDGVAADPAYYDEYTNYQQHFATSDPSTQIRTYAATATATTSSANPDSLESIADDLNLNAAARRELFGRGGRGGNKDLSSRSATKVINFNLDKEYQHNEELRSSGESQPAFNPVRAIQPGKHSLRQLVNAVQNQREALEDSFATNKRTKREAGSKYGWR